MSPVVFVFAALFGVAGFQEANRFQKQHGRTPWGWDPWVWAIVMFLSWVIGVVLLAIAERQGRNNAVPQVVPYAVAPGQMQYGTQYGAVSAMPPPVVTPAPTSPSDGFWAPDPSGRFEYRWWNGQQWTAAVSTAGVASQDVPTPGAS